MLTINPARALRNRRSRGRSRRNNPCGCGGLVSENPGALGWVGILGATALALGGGYWLYNELTHPPVQQPVGPGPYVDPANKLAGILKTGATLGEAPFVVNDVQQPIALASPLGSNMAGYPVVPELMVQTSTGQVGLAEAWFGSPLPSVADDQAWMAWLPSNQQIEGRAQPKAIAALVTNVNGDFARFVYEAFLAELAALGEAPENLDAIIADVLAEAAPGVDWSQGLAPYVYEDAAYKVWIAAQLIGTVAALSADNKGMLA